MSIVMFFVTFIVFIKFIVLAYLLIRLMMDPDD